jgi:myosin heavy subunit
MADRTIGFTLKVNGVQQAITSIDQLDQAVVDLETSLKQAEFGSAQFKELQKQLIAAKSAKEDLDKSLEGRGAEKRLQGIIGLAEGVGGAFALASQTATLFGKESEQLAKAEAKAQQAISVVLGIRAIKEGLLNSALERKIILEKASAAGTVILNAVNKAFNLTLSLNPIGLIVTAAGLLIVAFLNLIGPIKKLMAQFDFLNKAADAVLGTLRDIGSFLTGGLISDSATAKIEENATKAVEALDDIASAGNKVIDAEKRRLSFLEASGATEEAIYEQKQKITKAELKLKTDAANALIRLQQKTGELDEEQLKKLQELQKAIADLNQQAINEETAFEKKKADDKKKAAEEAKAKAKEAADKAAEALKKRREDALALEKDALKTSKDLQNQFYLESLKDEEFKAQETLRIQQEAAQKELQLQIDTLAKKKALTKEETAALTALRQEQTNLTAVQGQQTQALLDTQAETRKQKQKEFDAELKGLQQAATLGAIEDERERGRKTIEVDLQNQIDAINQRELTETQKAELIKAITTKSNQDLLELNKQYAEEDKQIDMAKLESKYANAQVQIDLVAQVGSFLSQIAGENKRLAIAGIVIEKAASIANIVANTGIANAKAVAATPLTAGQPFVGVNTVSAGLSIALAIAGAAKSIKEINAAGSEAGGGGGNKPTPSKFASGGMVYGPGSGSSDSIPALLSNGESVINAQSTQMFGGVLSAINQAGGGAPITNGGDSIAPIVKTYVVASEMSSQQEADFRINQIARL